MPQCIRAYKDNIAGFGIGVKYIEDIEETSEAEAEYKRMVEIIELLNTDQDTKEVFEDLIEARETYGIAYLEVIRNLDGEVQQIEFLHDTPSVRKTVPLEPYIDTTYYNHGAPIERKKKFRKYRQQLGGKTVYFKEFGDPRVMDRRNGVYVESPEDIKELPVDYEANEILEFSIGIQPYGEVRWTGQILGVDGSQRAERLNNNYFINGRHTPLMIMIQGGTLTEDSYEKLTKYMDDIKGEAGQHAFIVLETESSDGKTDFDQTEKPKIEVKDLASILQKDELFQTYMDNNRKKVQSSFLLPDIYVGYTTDFNRATAQTAQEVTEKQVFQPERRSLAWAINNRLLNGYAFQYVEAFFQEPNISNPDDICKIMTAATAAGGLTPSKAKENSLMDELDNNTESVHKNELENLALIARLSELASSTGEAAGKQQEMQAILDELNGNIDGLNMTYEDLTENQDKSLAYIKQMAQEQAKQEAYNEKYQEYVDLIKQQAQEQEELAKVQDEVTAAQQRANDAQKVYQDYIADLYAQDPTGMSTISAQWSEQAANADAAADALQEVLDKQTKLQDAYDETGKKIEEIEEGYTAAADAAKAAAEEGVTYGEAISQAYSDVRSDVEKLCQAYDDAYQAAKDSFEGQFDLFDQASTKSSDYLNASVSNAQAALDSQLNYWNTYTANIETLKATSADDLGITEENYKALMSYVQDGSEQAAGLAASMVQSINSGNKDAVAKLADTLADVTAKQDAAAQATADWVTDYENQLDDFQKKMEGTVDSLDLSDEAGKAAKDTIAEYVQKLKDGKKDAVAAAKDVAASVALALQNGSTPSVTTSTTTTVPGHAGGTTDAEDVFVAGENGPELIVGKQGSTVFPTEETDKIIDALNGMEPASDTSNEKKFDQFLQALTGVTVDAPEPGPGESLFDSVLGKVADIVSGKNSDLEAINAAYTGLPGVSTVALPASNAPIAAEAAPLNVQPNAQPAAQESTAATKEIAKRIILEIVGNGSVVVSGGSGGGMSEKAVLELLTNNIKPVLMGVIKDEIFEEGQLSYDY